MTTKKVTQYKPGDRRMPVQRETVKQSKPGTVNAVLYVETMKQTRFLDRSQSWPRSDHEAAQKPDAQDLT